MMNKEQMVVMYAKTYEISKKQAKQNIEEVIAMIQKAVIEEGGVDFYGFMKIEKVTQPARERVNPATGDKIMCEEKFVPKAKFSSRFKDAVKG